MCNLCSSQDETADHLFRKCEFTKRIWAACPLGIRNDHKNPIPNGEWVRGFINYLHLQDRDQSRVTLFIAIMWEIWLERNNRVFRGNSVDPNQLLKAISLIHNRIGNGFSRIPESNRQKQGNQVSWHFGNPCQQNLPIIQIDGAWKRVKKKHLSVMMAGIGWYGIIENQEHSASERVWAIDALQAEALALIKAVRTIGTMVNQLQIYTDSVSIIRGLQDIKAVPVHIQPILLDFIFFAKQLDYIVVRKVERSLVLQAHSLAVKARQMT